MSSLTETSAEVKRADAASYDATAAEFGELTELYSAQIARRMLDLIEVKAGERLLDLGTGTGLLARMAARRGTQAIGIDHSPGMITEAQARAIRENLASSTGFFTMDAEALKFDDSSFDAIVSLFVLRHLPDPAAAIREMLRTLKTGGRLVASIGARPNPFLPASFGSAAGAVSDRLQAALGRRLLSPASLRDFLRQEGLELGGDHAAHGHLGDVGRMLRDAGFRSVRSDWWGERHSLSSQEFWDVQAVFDSDARGALTGCDEQKLQDLRRRYIESCDRHVRRGHELVYRTGALIFTAMR